MSPDLAGGAVPEKRKVGGSTPPLTTLLPLPCQRSDQGEPFNVAGVATPGSWPWFAATGRQSPRAGARGVHAVMAPALLGIWVRFPSWRRTILPVYLPTAWAC